MHDAARNGKTEVATLLINNGANLDVVDKVSIIIINLHHTWHIILSWYIKFWCSISSLQGDILSSCIKSRRLLITFNKIILERIVGVSIINCISWFSWFLYLHVQNATWILLLSTVVLTTIKQFGHDIIFLLDTFYK